MRRFPCSVGTARPSSFARESRWHVRESAEPRLQCRLVLPTQVMLALMSGLACQFSLTLSETIQMTRTSAFLQLLITAAFVLATTCGPTLAQGNGTQAKGKTRQQVADGKARKPAGKKKKNPRPFQWVNKAAKYPVRVRPETFRSPSMNIDVGYCIYLPAAYESEKEKRFPVVYYLHGGRPGSETKSIALVPMIDKAIESNRVPPMIYVFVNGGPVSHYNMRKMKHGMGADVFIKELIPHIDSTYRTIASRSGRGLEGFSQGGRGTARLMFRHSNLFCSAAAGGGGHATEKRISENEGYENDHLRFDIGDNTWDLAREYAKRKNDGLKVMIYVGTKGFNYENNLQYMQHLKSLDIPFEKIIVPDAPHSARLIYQKQGNSIMSFHARNFGLLKE